MSYLERLRAKISPAALTPEPTKPPKPGYVSFVSTRPARSRPIAIANETSLQDLPLLAALAEFDVLIRRLCDLRGFNDRVRRDMERVRRCMSPDAIGRELPILRHQVIAAEGRSKYDR